MVRKVRLGLKEYREEEADRAIPVEMARKDLSDRLDRKARKEKKASKEYQG